MPVTVRKDIQGAVDAFVRLHAQMKAVREEMEALRQVIEPYMAEQGVGVITTSDGTARVERATQDRPLLSARYTTYELDEVLPLLPAQARKQCVVEVVDKEKLEALHKLGQVPDEALKCKRTRVTVTLSVRGAR
ncbi:hypothetical protein GCM10025857_21580 [Alicyclobacillus contaminans]|uniref:DUF7376 domain-containing protein n=1 Tax=Alicyclobacillus contaminans TaxID=392016 RepID=UPI0004165013|nr:hypothetical protein [Alicyclobacillus contaminans]GMA50801.1 hypothetical protein GCM10025857_21580 [Alicyclobacillus contaminans]